MGEIIERITLMNTGDESDLRRGRIKETEVRQMNVRAVVDTGAINLVINEKPRKKPGLELRETSEATWGNGKREVCGSQARSLHRTQDNSLLYKE